MANIKSIVDECLTIAEAFTSINSQTYNEIGAVNFEDNDKSYPFFLFDKRSVNFNVESYTRNGLPNRTLVTADVYFYDTYDESEKVAKNLQTKQSELITISNQFITELRTRNKSTDSVFSLNDITYKPIDEVHNDRLVEVAYTLEFLLSVDDCTLGTFNYA